MGRQELTHESVVARAPEALGAEVGREVVLMSVERGAYFALDPVGAEVWSRLGEPIAVRALCASLTHAYDVDADACAADVLPFLEELRAAGLLVVAAGDR